MSAFTGLPLLSQETIEVYKGIRHFTVVKDSLGASGDKLELQPLLDMAGRLDRRLLKIIRSQRDSPQSQMTSIYTLFGNAALIHQMMFIRQAPTCLSLSSILSKRIRKLLESISLETLQIQYPDMMLWVLMIGGIGGVGTQDQKWFAELFADACLAAGVTARAEITAALADFLWSDQYLGPICAEFWNDVIMAQVAKGWG
jgi:Fungal specific transcription factor domain